MNTLLEKTKDVTSLDMAHITGKRHADLMRDIRGEVKSLGTDIGERIFTLGSYKDKNNQVRPCYELGKSGAMQLALKYDPKTRYLVIKKIEELESSINKPSYMIGDPVARAQKWIDEQKMVAAIETENKELKPKAAYHDAILQSSTLLTTTSIAKDLGMGAPTLNKLLHDMGIQYKRNDRWYLYHKYQNKDYTHSKTHLVAAGKTKETMYWTQKGKQFVLGLIAEEVGV